MKRNNEIRSLRNANNCRPACRVTQITALMLLLFASGVSFAQGMNHGPTGPSPITNLIKSPEVPFSYALGMKIFQKKCSTCHGQWAEGVADTGPPLVHRFYKPGHHPDAAFYRAAKSGTRQHHWRFGDMPPVADISEEQVTNVIRFIRWWQVQNGIK